MDSFISVRANDQSVKVRARNNGTITEDTLRRAFLLEQDVPIGLFKNSMALECRREGNDYIFQLESGWREAEFTLRWEEARRSRPIKPIQQGNLVDYHPDRSESPRVFDAKLAKELRDRLYFIPRVQKAFQDPAQPSSERDENGTNGGCASPISSRAAVTYAYRTHRVLRVYDEEQNSEGNARSVVEIRKCDNSTIRHTMKVVVVDSYHDFVILFSIEGRDIFDDFPSSKRSPRNFEWFIGFGLSHKTDEGQQVTHRYGRICSDMVDYRGRMLASASFDGGYSGGPCYSDDRSLIGIMVPSTTTDPRLGQEYDRSSLEEDASSNPADIWITPGNCITEAYRRWQVQQVQRERELGDPKAKRRAIDTS